MNLNVPRQVSDPLSEQRDLNLCGSGIALTATELSNELGGPRSRQHLRLPVYGLSGLGYTPGPRANSRAPKAENA